MLIERKNNLLEKILFLSAFINFQIHSFHIFPNHYINIVIIAINVATIYRKFHEINMIELSDHESLSFK